MRVAVTGRNGQVAQSIRRRAEHHGIELHSIARPEMDLTRPDTIARAVAEVRPDIVINAAAHTAVDQAESERDLVFATNAEGARGVAAAAAAIGVPVIQLSTDFVFGGTLSRPYREDDETGPLSVYGASKLAGERAVAEANPDHAVLRTSWLFSPFGRNFARTMLNLATTRDEIGVVRDQIGSPTSTLALADGILAVAKNLLARPKALELRGLFHLTNAGEATWAELAAAIFRFSSRYAGPSAQVRPIPTSDYPTPARRPANSRLDSAKIAAVHNVRLGDWRETLPACIEEIILREFSETPAR